MCKQLNPGSLLCHLEEPGYEARKRVEEEQQEEEEEEEEEEETVR